MIFNIQHQADWERIKQRKQDKINQNNKRENAHRIPHTYRIGDKVLLRRGTENKMEAPFSGPYEILEVCDNGTVKIKIGSVEDQVNLHRIKPYHE